MPSGVWVEWSGGEVSVAGGNSVPLVNLTGPFPSHVEAADWISDYFRPDVDDCALDRHRIRILDVEGSD